MLGQLIESRPRHERYGRGLLVSGIVHALIIVALLLLAPELNAGHGEAATGGEIVYHHPVTPETERVERQGVEVESSPPQVDGEFPFLPDPIAADVQVALPDGVLATIPDVTATLGDVRRALEQHRTVAGDPRPVRGGLAGDGPVSLDRVERAPLVLREASPIYPALLRERGVQGSVTVQFTIDGRGLVPPSSIRVLEGGELLFVEEVRRALARARYRPAEIGGRPVAVVVQQRFVFEIAR